MVLLRVGSSISCPVQHFGFTSDGGSEDFEDEEEEDEEDVVAEEDDDDDDSGDDEVSPTLMLWR